MGLAESGQASDEGLEIPSEGSVAVVLPCQVVVGMDGFLSEVLVVEEALNLIKELRRDKTIHHREKEPFGFDILNKDGVAIDDHGNPKIEGLKQSVSEAFVGAEIGDEVGMRVGIPKGVSLASLLIGLAHVGDSIGDDSEPDPLLSGEFFKKMLVFHALVTRFVGDDQFALGVVQSAYQPNGVLDAFAGHDPGGLEDEEIIVFQADRRLEILAIVIGRRRVLLCRCVVSHFPGNSLRSAATDTLVRGPQAGQAKACTRASTPRS